MRPQHRPEGLIPKGDEIRESTWSSRTADLWRSCFSSAGYISGPQGRRSKFQPNRRSPHPLAASGGKGPRWRSGLKAPGCAAAQCTPRDRSPNMPSVRQSKGRARPGSLRQRKPRARSEAKPKPPKVFLSHASETEFVLDSRARLRQRGVDACLTAGNPPGTASYGKSSTKGSRRRKPSSW